MGATTLRLPEKKLMLLRALAGLENRPMSTIVEELVDDYVERNKETLEIITNKKYLASILRGLKDSQEGKITSQKEVKKLLHVED